jgi:hypothetical protein
MGNFAKGGDVRVASYAAGGPVLGKDSAFLKTPDQFRSDKSKATDEVFTKSGKDSLAKRTGDKCLTPVKPRG